VSAVIDGDKVVKLLQVGREDEGKESRKTGTRKKSVYL